MAEKMWPGEGYAVATCMDCSIREQLCNMPTSCNLAADLVQNVYDQILQNADEISLRYAY